MRLKQSSKKFLKIDRSGLHPVEEAVSMCLAE